MSGYMSYYLLMFVTVALSTVQLGMLAGGPGLRYVRVVVGLLGYLSVKVILFHLRYFIPRLLDRIMLLLYYFIFFSHVKRLTGGICNQSDLFYTNNPIPFCGRVPPPHGQNQRGRVWWAGQHMDLTCTPSSQLETCI